MTAIIGVGFPDEAIILSDSRISELHNRIPPRDNLKKIYQLSSHLCFAYTTNDVEFTHKLIEKITIFSQSLKTNDTSEVLRKITDFSNTVYKELSEDCKNTPQVQFLYVGLSLTKPYFANRYKLKQIISNNKSKLGFSEKLKNLNLNTKDKKVPVPSPTPILCKQFFPEYIISTTLGWDFSALGAGKKVEKEIEKYYSQVCFFGKIFDKGIILRNLLEDYFKEKNIYSVGGTVQTFFINKEGVHPLLFEEKSENKVLHRVSMDNEGNWIDEDLKDGKKTIVKQKP